MTPGILRYVFDERTGSGGLESTFGTFVGDVLCTAKEGDTCFRVGGFTEGGYRTEQR